MLLKVILIDFYLFYIVFLIWFDFDINFSGRLYREGHRRYGMNIFTISEFSAEYF